MIRVLWQVWALYLLLGPLGQLRAESPILRVDDQGALDKLPVMSFLQFHWDDTGRLDLDRIRSLPAGAWEQLDSSKQSFGYRTGDLWLKLALDDQRSKAGALVLSLQYPIIDRIDFFQVAGQRLIRLQAGDHIPPSQTPFRSLHPAFPIDNLGSSEVFLRIRTSSSYTVPFTLTDFTTFYEQSSVHFGIQCLYFGALLALVIYNLFVWVMSRYRVYGLYVLGLLSFAWFQLLFSGMFRFLLDQDVGRLFDLSTLFAAMFTIVTGVVFFMSLIDFGSKRPLFVKAAWGVCGISVSCLIVALFLPLHVALPLFLRVSALPTLIFLSVSAVYASLQGERPAKWYLIAGTAVIVGTFIGVLRALGYLPTNLFTMHAQQFGSAVDFLLLSLTLGDKIRSLQIDVQRQQQLALVAEQSAHEADKRALEASTASLCEQQRLTNLKDEFLANTSHELRTPLNMILGMAETLASRRYLQQTDQTAAQSLVAASIRLKNLIDDLLSFSALSRGGQQLKQENFDIVPCLAACLEQQRVLIQEKGLRCQIPHELDRWYVQADQERTQLSLRAILSNAVKFTAQGQIEITIAEGEDWIDLTVRDTGIGISADRVADLQEAFVQGDGSSRRRQGGTGLGLALAQKAMQSQLGALEITSVQGVGTSVLLRFPKGVRPLLARRETVGVSTALPWQAAAGEALSRNHGPAEPLENKPQETQRVLRAGLKLRYSAKTDAQEEATKPPRSPAKMLRILVVDDESMNRHVIRMHLASEDYEIFEAEDGPKALSLWKQEGPFDAVLLDVMMPGMNGYEVCRELRREAELSILPILILTAKQEVSDLVEGFAAGANDYIHKPFSREELLARLDMHLGSSRTTLAMHRFVPRDFIRLLGHQHIADVNLGDATEHHMAVLFADVRNFTSTVERMSPPETFQWLNRCYAIMGPEIRHAGGFIDKYIGDAVLALFPGSVDQAVEAALAMHQGLARAQDCLIGTGIHVGPTMIGTLGEPERFDATVLSDVVNVASRIENACKVLGASILVSAEAYRAMSQVARYQWRYLGRVQLRGRHAPLEIYEILDVNSQRELKQETSGNFARGIELFQAAQWQAAQDCFHQVLEHNPLDLAAILYRDQCVEHAEQGFKGEIFLVLLRQ